MLPTNKNWRKIFIGKFLNGLKGHNAAKIELTWQVFSKYPDVLL